MACSIFSFIGHCHWSLLRALASLLPSSYIGISSCASCVMLLCSRENLSTRIRVSDNTTTVEREFTRLHAHIHTAHHCERCGFLLKPVVLLICVWGIRNVKTASTLPRFLPSNMLSAPHNKSFSHAVTHKHLGEHHVYLARIIHDPLCVSLVRKCICGQTYQTSPRCLCHPRQGSSRI